VNLHPNPAAPQYDKLTIAKLNGMDIDQNFASTSQKLLNFATN